ncbi:metalloprotease [Plasmodium gonderi]|uniref:Metalloprotease n=1 Tax=Plasmodium gonderi TaxID=77519 RepID=A0A1Y1JJJ3_PLAGO|nr:metalloprotease [Plasmodium gonderi]GAW82669.1 metalloprotease [Plasmodium gonderi]
MEEIRKKVEHLRENIKQINKKIQQFDAKKNVQQILLKNGKEKEKLSDLLFLVQYSLKYKNLCKWPNYNDLFVINYNINDNFKSIIQKHEKFFHQYKNFTPPEGEVSTIAPNPDKYSFQIGNNEKNATTISTKIVTTNDNNDINSPHTRENKINDNSTKDVENKSSTQRSSTNKMENIYTQETHLTKEHLAQNSLSNNAQEKKKKKKIITHFNDDISHYNRIKLQIFMYFMLNNYRIKILVDSLSALNRPINVIYINCPNNKEQKKTFFEKITGFFTSPFNVNDIFVNNESNHHPHSKENCSCSELHSFNNNSSNNNSNQNSNNSSNHNSNHNSNNSSNHNSNHNSNNSSNHNSSNNKKNSNYVGGYNPISNTIWLCSNNISNYYKLKYILTHELIHAFDFARANIDMYNCHHIACSEIRAYNMSNQCSYFNSKYFETDHDAFTYFKSPSISATRKNKCIYNNVYSSLYQYKPCVKHTHTFINHVFEKCLHDYWPFMSPPEQDSKYKPSKIFKKDP